MSTVIILKGENAEVLMHHLQFRSVLKKTGFYHKQNGLTSETLQILQIAMEDKVVYITNQAEKNHDPCLQYECIYQNTANCESRITSVNQVIY